MKARLSWDTGLLMAGILSTQSFFDQQNPTEQHIRSVSDSLFLAVEWDWAMNGNYVMSMGWHPESGFIKSTWRGYNEAMILYVMALGSPTHTIPAESWKPGQTHTSGARTSTRNILILDPCSDISTRTCTLTSGAYKTSIYGRNKLTILLIHVWPRMLTALIVLATRKVM